MAIVLLFRNRLDSSRVDEDKEHMYKTLTEVPPKGKFVLENVLDSMYFFS